MNKTLSILIATGIYPPDIGGPATYVDGLEKHLRSLGHNVRVVTYADRGFVSRQWPKIIRHIIYFFSVLWFGRSVDVIYLQDVVSAGVPTICANFLLRRRLILKIVGDYAWEQGRVRYGIAHDLDDFQKRRYGLRVELLRSLQRSVARCADEIIVPSAYLARIVEQWKINKERIHIIYNATFDQLSAAVNQLEHVKNDRTALLTIGRLVPWKGFRYLIALMRDLPGRTLYIVGDGPERHTLELFSRELHVEDRVHIIGMVPHEQLIDYFNHARIFLLNSHYEGLSHVLIEALQYGVPVIATNIGGNPEVINDGENGFLVPPDDLSLVEYIRRLYVDDALWLQMSHAAKQSTLRFTWETHMKQLLPYLEI